MTEQELRALVREAIARHLGGVNTTDQRSQGPEPRAPRFESRAPSSEPRFMSASHQMFVLADGSQSDGPCIIEPAVMCNHCGYCKSYGH